MMVNKYKWKNQGLKRKYDNYNWISLILLVLTLCGLLWLPDDLARLAVIVVFGGLATYLVMKAGNIKKKDKGIK